MGSANLFGPVESGFVTTMIRLVQQAVTKRAAAVALTLFVMLGAGSCQSAVVSRDTTSEPTSASAFPSSSVPATPTTTSTLVLSTPPTLGSTAPIVRLAVAGDVGTGDSHAMATGRLMADGGTYEGLILLGDNVYPNGDPDRLGATVFEPFGQVLEEGARLLPVLGNHDVRDDHAEGQVAALGMPGRWYSAEIGPVLLIALDSNVAGNRDQLAWLESTLSTNEAPWVIVAAHHPAFSAGYHGPTEKLQELWVPLFERFGVDLVLAGHDHDYQRTIPINGVTYVVSGAGAKLRPTGKDQYTAYSASVRHFVEIAVWPDRIELSAIALDGPFDHVTLERDGT